MSIIMLKIMLVLGMVGHAINMLKKGIRYYVKVCPYTIYDDGTKVFGQNSLAKTVVVKKK